MLSVFFNQPKRGFYIIARDKLSNPAGCLMIQKEWSDCRNADIWWMHSVYVLPDHRRNGIFQQMINYAEELAQNSGIKGLRLYVDKTNKKAQSVYSKLEMNNNHYEMFEKMY